MRHDCLTSQNLRQDCKDPGGVRQTATFEFSYTARQGADDGLLKRWYDSVVGLFCSYTRSLLLA